MEYIKAVIKCEIKVMDPPLKSVRGVSGNKVGYSPSVWPALSSFASEGEEFERRTKKNLRLGQKKFEHWTREESGVGTIDPAGSRLGLSLD